MLDPEFWEWLHEGTPEEKIEKQRKFIAYLRAHPEIYAGKPEWLDDYEEGIRRYETAHHRVLAMEMELNTLKYEAAEADRNLDQALINEENLPIIPLFGRRKKDSH